VFHLCVDRGGCAGCLPAGRYLAQLAAHPGTCGLWPTGFALDKILSAARLNVFSLFSAARRIPTPESTTFKTRNVSPGERRGPDWRVTVESIKHRRVKLLVAAAGTSAVVAIGGLAAVAVSQQHTGTVMGGPMAAPATTTTTPPATPATTMAVPPMKATRPSGF
jgi:hypothetical protein